MTDRQISGLRERLGEWLGARWAPLVGALTQLRHARMFHPDGHTFHGVITPACDLADEYGPLAAGLRGRVLARFSGALWRGERERLDVLGLALRIRPGSGELIDQPARAGAQPALDHRAAAGDTDLLTATIRSPLTMLASPLFTNATDFVGNRYWAVSPFAPDGVGHRVELRLVPVDPPDLHGRRVEKLAAAVQAGGAEWWLEARRTLRLRWRPVCRVTLFAPAAIDQAALRFDPFRGVLNPVGLVHAIRRATYATGQRARALASP